MSGSSSHGVYSVILLLMLLHTTSVAKSTEIVVGGTTGWTTKFDYDAWSLTLNLQPRVGDTLIFKNPDSMTHTVALLSSLDAYERCVLGGASNITPIAPGTNVTVVIPGTLEGQTLYVVCTIPGHCMDNQKIKATVLAALTNATTPSSSPPPSTAATAPPGNDSDMNRIICWTTAILLIVACFWNLS